MNFSIIENQANSLRTALRQPISPRKKIILILDFFYELKSNNNKLLQSTYHTEFFGYFKKLLKTVEPEGLHPARISQILDVLNDPEFSEILSNENDSENTNDPIIKNFYFYQKHICDHSAEERLSDEIYFPLIEKVDIPVEGDFGFLDSISVQIKKTQSPTKFLITPAWLETEEKFLFQLQNSLSSAIKIVKQNVKIKDDRWKIFIHFEKRYGEYIGNSFGLALTVKLVEEFLKYYDSKVKVAYATGIALTGGVEAEGNIISFSRELIELKTKIVFFSYARIFIVPESLKIYAKDIADNLKLEFPKRDLQIVGIEDIEDLFNRRNLVFIKRDNSALRTYKFVKKNWVTFILLVLFSLVLIYSGIIDFDDNPFYIKNEGNFALIQNKNGKTLHKIKAAANFDANELAGYAEETQMIVDIDADGDNEFLLTYIIDDENFTNTSRSAIRCFDKNANLIWSYIFDEPVYTIFENHTRTYNHYLIDTASIGREKFIFCFANNAPNYPSAIFKLNLKTGEKHPDVFRHSGHIGGAHIRNSTNDSDKVLTVLALNNGLERVVLFSIKLTELFGQSPAPESYKFLNTPIANFIEYVLIPNPDLVKYFNLRFASIGRNSLVFSKNSSMFEFATSTNEIGLNFTFDINLKLADMSFSDQLIMTRDSLVTKGLLSQTLTRTVEYRNWLMNQLKYWDGKKFISPEERFTMD